MSGDQRLHEVPLDDAHWNWGGTRPTHADHLGRPCITLETPIATVADVALEDGVIELDLAVSAQRGFHGLVWRLADRENFESFFVRPHQMGNPTPSSTRPSSTTSLPGSSTTGPASGLRSTFPLGDWFTIRVAFQGARAEVFVGDAREPGLVVRELKQPIAAGGIGIMAGSPSIHVARFAYDTEAMLGAPLPPGPPPAAASSPTGASRTRSRKPSSPASRRSRRRSRGANLDRAPGRAHRARRSRPRERDPRRAATRCSRGRR